MKFSPYSHSKLDVYRQCPYRFKLKYIDKVVIPKTENLALYRGSYIHERIENYYNEITFETNEIFTDKHKAICDDIITDFQESDLGKFYYNRDNEVHEKEFGFKLVDGKLTSCSYDDKDAWLRGKIDYLFIEDNILYIVDWKSGDSKVDSEYFTDDQMITYVIWAFLTYPNIDTVYTSFVYVEHLNERKNMYKREDFTKYVKRLYTDTKHCETDTKLDKDTGPLCEWCDYKKNKHCDGEVDMSIISTGLQF